MAKPATLRVDILADSKKATAELDGFSSKVAGFTAGITSAFTGFAIDKITDAATASARFLVDSVQAAGSLSAALGTLNQNYGESAQTVAAWAKTAADAVGLSELKAINAANKFATYSRFLGLTGKAAADFSTELVTMAADLAAFSDLPVEQAIQAIGSALRGERDPLEQFGILLNDAQVKAAYFRKTGIEVNGTLTTQQNIIGTLAALTEQGATATGAFARESDQLGNKQQVLGSKIEDLSTRIGTVLLPVVNDMISRFGGPLLDALGEVTSAFEQDGLSGAFDVIGRKWSEAGPKLAGGIDDIFETVTTYINEHPPDFASWIKAASEWLELIIKGDGTDENPGIIVRVTRLVTAIEDAFLQNDDKVKEAGNKAGQSLGGAIFDGTWRALSERLVHMLSSPENWPFFMNPLTWAFDIGANLGRDIGTGIVNWIKKTITEDLPNAAKWAIEKALKAIGGPLGSAVGDIIFGRSERAQAQTVNFYTTVNAEIPPGVYGWDAGAAIAAQLEDYYARTGFSVQ